MTRHFRSIPVLCILATIWWPASATAVLNIRNVSWEFPSSTPWFPEHATVRVSFEADVSERDLVPSWGMSLMGFNELGGRTLLARYNLYSLADPPPAETHAYFEITALVVCNYGENRVAIVPHDATVRYSSPQQGVVIRSLPSQSANTWAFFQAKNIRRHVLRLQIGELEVLQAAEPELTESARSAIADKIKQYRAKEAHLSSEPETGEGLKELLVKGKSLEAQRDLAMRKDRYFDYGMALLQIAIVLASVSIITGGTSLLVLSVLISAVGIISTLNGFTLVYTVPFIG